jgi:DNA-binding transcriptional ArsR family regulator
MARTTKQRLQDAHAAIAAIQRYVPSEALERLNDDLTRSAVERQLSIVREALRVALLQDPGLRRCRPELAAAMARCDQLRDWENPVEVQELAEFVEGELKGWQSMIAVLVKESLGEGGEAGSADGGGAEGEEI